MEPLGVTLQAVLDNPPVAEDRVLVIGAGVIGNLLVQSIRALQIPCSITVAEPSHFHGELAVRAGADHLISDGDIPGAALKLTGAAAYNRSWAKTFSWEASPRSLIAWDTPKRCGPPCAPWPAAAP